MTLPHFLGGGSYPHRFRSVGARRNVTTRERCNEKKSDLRQNYSEMTGIRVKWKIKMSTITKIEKQKKEGRYNIFLDDVFAFGAYRETVFNFGLRVNDKLDEKKIKEIKSYDEINFGKKVAYRFLNYKPRSEKEVITKLKEKKVSQKSINEIIKSLKSLNYLNDEQYAKMYIEEKLQHKPEGRRLLAIKLSGKGIDKDTVQSIIEEKYSEDIEINKIKDLLEKYIKRVKYKSPFEKKQKCYRFLLSKGFDYDIINEVINEQFGKE